MTSPVAEPASRAGRHRRATWAHDAVVVGMALAAGAPAVLATLVLLHTGDFSTKVRWTVAVVVVTTWLLVPVWLRDRVVRPLRTLSSVLEAFREGDYSVRGRAVGATDALGEAMRELNALGDALRRHRLDALEAGALLEKVLASTDVAILAVDDRRTVRLANAAAERLVAHGTLVGKSAGDVGVEHLLEGDAPRTLTASWGGVTGVFELRRSRFRLAGRPHELIVLADVHRALREQERQAWQRLVRVLGHEINSSLAPIRSIADNVLALLARDPRPDDWEEDARSGLSVVARRADALSRFMTAYAKLARLPPPTLAMIDVRAWAERVARLEQRLTVACAGPHVRIAADGDQLDQLLINLVKNAAEAAVETGGGVRVAWREASGWLELAVEDDGPGVGDAGNLFVPFFTTKPDGSGIGLALARQIAEGHGGTLDLENRSGARGAVARLRLPCSSSSSSSSKAP